MIGDWNAKVGSQETPRANTQKRCPFNYRSEKKVKSLSRV